MLACRQQKMSNVKKSIFIVAVEPSGDRLGAELIDELKPNDHVELSGIGGAAMARAGISNDYDISPLAILGFTEALKAYPKVITKVREAVDMIMDAGPDAVVLIDSWGFMIRVSKLLKRRGFAGKIIKYVAPQVWAMREGRARILARHVDHLLSIHSFDAPYFTKHGLPVTFVGNPMFDDGFTPSNKTDFKTRHNIKADSRILAVLFGSRPAEIERLMDPFLETVSRLSDMYPDLIMASPLSDGVRDMVLSHVEKDERLKKLNLLPEAEKYDLFSSADVAMACSGTVTTQLAVMGVPTVVAYKLSPVTFFFARRLFKPDYISLVNISADKLLMPEFMQGDVRADVLRDAVSQYLDDDELRIISSQALVQQAAIMKGKGGSASAKAASAILKILN